MIWMLCWEIKATNCVMLFCYSVIKTRMTVILNYIMNWNKLIFCYLVWIISQSPADTNILFFMLFLCYDMDRIAKYEYTWQGTRTNKDMSAEFDHMMLDNITHIIACKLNPLWPQILKKQLSRFHRPFLKIAPYVRNSIPNNGWSTLLK